MGGNGVVVVVLLMLLVLVEVVVVLWVVHLMVEAQLNSHRSRGVLSLKPCAPKVALMRKRSAVGSAGRTTCVHSSSGILESGSRPVPF